MDAVHQWALGICLTVLINAVVHYVIPSGIHGKNASLGSGCICSVRDFASSFQNIAKSGLGDGKADGNYPRYRWVCW